jgi:hypothetical protein
VQHGRDLSMLLAWAALRASHAMHRSNSCNALLVAIAWRIILGACSALEGRGVRRLCGCRALWRGRQSYVPLNADLDAFHTFKCPALLY